MSPFALAGPPALLLLSLLGGAPPAAALRRLHEVYSWKTVAFDFPSEQAKQAMVQSGAYVPGNGVPVDVDVFTEGERARVFVTLPRLQPGTAATLTEVAEGGGKAPLLRPFPDWSWQRQGDCDALSSVFRIQVDACGRLWALDSGTVNILSTFERICAPQLVVFDVRGGGRAVRKHRFPDGVSESGSLFITVAVDIRGAPTPASCGAAFAYAADVTEYALAVYDLQRDRSWRVEHKYFYPYPTHGTFRVAGDTFDLMDGVFGLALSPENPRGGDRRLYYHALASVRENWVSANVLRNESLYANGGNGARDLFRLSEGERPSQAGPEAMDRHGALFFSLLESNTLNCWPAATGAPYSARSIVELDRDDEALQFVSGLKVLPAPTPQELWLISCRFQKLMTGEGHDPNDVNFRVMRAAVPALVKGTKCDQPRKNGYERPQPSRPGTGGGYVPVIFS